MRRREGPAEPGPSTTQKRWDCAKMAREMNSCCKWWKWGGISRVPPFIIFALLLATLLIPMITATPAKADGGIAISGSFYRQIFEIPQGSSVSGPSIYVTVFNQSTAAFSVNMTSAAPIGVTVTLSQNDFVLQPGTQQQVWITVAAGEDAVPGYYENGVEVTAMAWTEGGEGIQILGAAAQNATLLVTGEWARVVVDSVGPNGQPVATQLRLFKVIDGQNYEFAQTNTGHLEAIVSPGSYIAYSYNNGTELALESFQVAAGEETQVTLTVNTIYFSHFEILPAYNDDTGELGFVQVSYTVKNVYQQMSAATVRLIVTLNGAPIEDIEILNLSPLNLGDFGAPYTYIPAGGWKTGTYGFSLQLYVDVQLYAGTQPQTLEVAASGGLDWWIFVLAALGGGLLIGGIIMFFKRRRKSDKPEKAKKSGKHEGKESPAGGEAAGGIALGFKRLLRRGDKTAKRPAVSARGTAVTKTGAIAATAAKKDAATATQTQQPGKAVPVIDITKPPTEKPAVGQVTAAGKQAVAAQAATAPPPPATRPSAAPAQASTVAKPSAAQPATHIKSAADLKRVIGSRQSDGTTPPPAATPGTPAREAAPASTTAAPVVTARRDPLSVPSPFAAPRQGPPTKKARHGKKGVVPGAAAVPGSTAAPAAGPAFARPLRETAADQASAATVTPESIEPLPVPSPFLTPKELRAAEEAMAARHTVAEASPAASLPVEEPVPVPPSVGGEEPEAPGETPFEAVITAPAATQDTEAESSQVPAAPVQEPASLPASVIEEEAEVPEETTPEAAITAPPADRDATPAVMKEEEITEPAEDKTDASGAEIQADSKAEDQAPQEPQQDDDEADKKFVSPIRFLNR